MRTEVYIAHLSKSALMVTTILITLLLPPRDLFAVVHTIPFLLYNPSPCPMGNDIAFCEIVSFPLSEHVLRGGSRGGRAVAGKHFTNRKVISRIAASLHALRGIIFLSLIPLKPEQQPSTTTPPPSAYHPRYPVNHPT